MLMTFKGNLFSVKKYCRKKTKKIKKAIDKVYF